MTMLRLFTIALLSFECTAHAGTQLHGGDPFVVLLNDARWLAHNGVRNINFKFIENFGAAGTWLKANQSAVMDELANSPIVAFDDLSPIGTCAATEASPQATINF